MGDDRFSSRLGAAPDAVYVDELRGPEFELLREHFVDPLLLLGRAHVVMLAEVDLLEPAAAGDVLAVLEDVEAEGVDATGAEFEDVHFYMESVLIDRLGPATGGTLQTGRSRTDVYDAAVRLVLRDLLLDVVDAVLVLRDAVLDRAAGTTDVVTTAYTHGQPAQPITLAHYLLAFDHLLERDVDRLLGAYDATNRNPLGTAVTGGTGFDVDRERLSELAGYDGLVYNTYDAIASMDFVPEATHAAALLMTNVSRLARDLVDWSTHEFGLVEPADGFASVSSLMPQKKNPYPLEKLRTEAADTIGAATSALTHLKGAPYGDVSEVAKYAFVPLLEQRDEVVRGCRLLAGVVETLEVHEERMERNARENFSTMTELADTLVRAADLSFRQAHEVVGTAVRTLLEDGRSADEMTLADLDAAAEATLGRPTGLPAASLEAALDPRENVARRDLVGGTAPACNEADLERQRASLEADRDRLATARERLSAADRERAERVEDLLAGR